MAIGTLNRAYYRERGIDPDRIFWMPYVVDNAFFSARAAQSALTRERFRASLGLDPTRPVVLFASKLHRRKRPLDLLEAFVRLSSHGYAQPWPYLLFVGDGEEAPSLRARIQALGWDSVRLLGFRNQSELPSFYDLCDVFVLPSEAEPWGLVVNEVMNAAKPVIVTDQVGCAPDLVTNGDNGYVVPPRDPAALADKIARLTTNPARQSHMGRGSLQRIREWDLDIAVAGFRAAIRSLHSRRTVP
jgi:glycosyltransferase involved in cell wall biosynthesis